jgi:uncharacterized membrane protein
MRYIKMFLVGLLVLAILFTLFSFFIPSTVRVSRVVEIYAPKEKIYEAVSDVKYWKHWMPWSGADSLFTITINPSANKINSSYAWFVKNDESKKGKISITSLSADEIITENELSGYKTSPGSIKFYTDPNAKFVLVEWKIKVGIKWYPWAKLKGILLDKIYGPVLEDGLERLKQQIEGSN